VVLPAGRDLIAKVAQWTVLSFPPGMVVCFGIRAVPGSMYWTMIRRNKQRLIGHSMISYPKMTAFRVVSLQNHSFGQASAVGRTP